MMGGGMMAGVGGGLGLLTIGLLVGLVFLVIWLWQRFGALAGTTPKTQSSETKQPSAREILQARYARGELTREEYQAILEDLA
ncbi:MAG: SHOCT domain-containing protein [Anaerolineae bacterium]|jgi:putative membrane protein